MVEVDASLPNEPSPEPKERASLERHTEEIARLIVTAPRGPASLVEVDRAVCGPDDEGEPSLAYPQGVLQVLHHDEEVFTRIADATNCFGRNDRSVDK
jgi:hypothetical protein